MGSSSTSSLLACLIQFGLLSRGLWKFVWSISHVSPAVSRVCPLESDPNRTMDHHHSPLCFSSPAMWLDLSLSILMAPSYPLISTCCVQYFPHIICSTCFLSGWSVIRPSSAFCILWPMAERALGWRWRCILAERPNDGGENMFGAVASCSDAVESTVVESSPIAYLHLHTRTCSITFLISITNSPSSSSASTQLAAAMNKRNFLAVQRIRSSLYRNIVASFLLAGQVSRPVCSEPDQEQRKAALLSSIQINLFEHHRPSEDFIFVYLPDVFYD